MISRSLGFEDVYNNDAVEDKTDEEGSRRQEDEPLKED